ncbi:hypothetical protein ACJD0Z_17045 [Flavobacteriaceae bacterium M23B6Z8]
MKKLFILILLLFFGRKNEPICTVNENNAGKEIYDLDEATCFIGLKLNKKKSYLNLIREALMAEMNYMDKIQLISNKPNSASKFGQNIELDINKMVKYALVEEKVDLTEDELYEIYNTEVEYLIFIGVVTE